MIENDVQFVPSEHIAPPQGAIRLYEAALASIVDPRRRKNLELIWDVLANHYASGSTDFGLASVGRLIEAAGGPRTQSLRNEGGRQIREIIAAFWTKPSAKTAAQANESEVEREIARIPNLAVQVSLRMLLADKQKLKVENDQLRSAFKALSVDVGAKNPQAPVMAFRGDSMASESVQSLKLFASEEWLESHGLTLANDGSVTCSWMGEAMIAPPGFKNAIDEVIELASVATFDAAHSPVQE